MTTLGRVAGQVTDCLVHARYPAPAPPVSILPGTFGTGNAGTLAGGAGPSLVAGFVACLEDLGLVEASQSRGIEAGCSIAARLRRYSNAGIS